MTAGGSEEAVQELAGPRCPARSALPDPSGQGSLPPLDGFCRLRSPADRPQRFPGHPAHPAASVHYRAEPRSARMEHPPVPWPGPPWGNEAYR